MKKINILQLVASIFLLFGNIIYLLNLCMDIPFALYLCSGPLFLISSVLYGVVLGKMIKFKKNSKDTEGN